MFDWLWLWVAGIMQRRAERRVAQMEYAAELSLIAANPAERCYPQDCDSQCPNNDALYQQQRLMQQMSAARGVSMAHHGGA